jgi:outer membrane immunogenic protein
MKFIVAVLAGLFGATSAMAADLPARVYTKAPAFVDPGYNWSGFYLGGNVGYSWGKSNDTSAFTNGAGTTLSASIGSSNLDGVVGGGQAGYNWQVQNWVWGLEGDIQATGERGSRDISCPVGLCTPSTVLPGFRALVILVPGAAVPASFDQKIDWFGTVRARRHPGDAKGAVLCHRWFGVWRSQFQRDDRRLVVLRLRHPRGVHGRRRHRRRDRRQLDREA